MEHGRLSTGQLAILAVALGGAVVLAFGPSWMVDPGAAPEQAGPRQRAVAVFVLCLALWLTHAIPLAITGLMAFALLPLLGVASQRSVLAHLGNPAVFFMMGVFFLVAAMIATGLSKRLTLVMLQRLDRSPRSLFLGVLLTSSGLSLLMPEHAVAAMLFPVVLEIIEALKLPKRGSRYARLLLMGMAWGACIGGVGTFLGGARAPLAISLLEEYGGQPISFLWWAVASVPVVVVLTGIAAIVLPLMVGIDVDDVSGATRMINERVAHLGPTTAAERRLAGLCIVTIGCWIALGHEFVSLIAVASACMLFFLRIVAYRDIQDFINWNVLLMYGGAIAIGKALHETGAVGWLVHRVDWAEIPPVAIVVLLAVGAVVLTECISNTATVVVLLPIGFGIAAQARLDPVFITLAVTIPAGLPFCLPVSSPPHAIAFSAGFYEPGQCLKPGALMDIVGLLVVIGVMLVYWPLIGISLTL